MSDTGIIIIGRNEGERLRRCIASVKLLNLPIIYVDSGSTDGSVGCAREMGAEAVELTPDRAFTAARGRNAGVARLLEVAPAAEFVQFIDGDCVLDARWLDVGCERLRSQTDLAVVCGRLREMSLDRSVYRRLLNMEWDGPIGDIVACGGISLMRIKPFVEMKGFNESVPAGEEADLCIRLRSGNYRIERIGCNMAEHDSGIDDFGKWWKRAIRSGQSFAQGSSLHGGGSDARHQKALRSIFAWGLCFPVLIIAVAWPSHGWSIVAGTLMYSLLWLKITRRQKRRCSMGDACLYASFCIVGKFAEVVGALGYYLKRRKSGALSRERSGSDLQNAAAVPTPTSRI